MLDDLRYITALDVSAGGFLADALVRARVDVTKVFHLSWAHTCLEDGIVTNDLSHFVEATETKIGLGARLWEDRLRAGWNFPSNTKVKQRTMHRLFNAYRIPDDKKISAVKGSMSDMLGVYGLIRHIVETTPEFDCPELALERASLMNCCEVVDAF